MLKIFFPLVLAICCYACNSDGNELTLKDSSAESDASITYSASEKQGNFINATKQIAGVKTHYSFRVNDNGEVLHVLKYHNEPNSGNANNLDYYRDMQLLVSDTTKIYGPNFFGEPIDGYYKDTFLMNNVVRNKSTVKIVLRVVTEEQELFLLVDSLTQAKKIKYVHFDTSQVLGWFSYKV